VKIHRVRQLTKRVFDRLLFEHLGDIVANLDGTVTHEAEKRGLPAPTAFGERLEKHRQARRRKPFTVVK
jgi:hypothetical protein